ncbi:hypothetical protein CYMTET_23602 [Cymbomonas tetramitiformis]|uniref:Senescence domain-containing protein n=1 Tax=Cymbomonas tetramitiformis TaxID=36881 RepID=A0AAE0FY61_9CHLO|nr:hypothetical protein CYMTET_23602 [Cymbomonas tetramitiformis]
MLLTGTLHVQVDKIQTSAGVHDLRFAVQEVLWAVKANSPVIKMEARLYVFIQPGQFYGVMIQEGESEAVVTEFEEFLKKHSAFRVHASVAASQPAESLWTQGADMMAGAISTSANMVSAGVLTTAGLVEGGLKATSATGKQYLPPSETPMQISDTTMNSMETLKQTSERGNVVATAVKTSLVDTTKQIATTAADVIKAESGFQAGGSGGDKTKAVQTVVTAGLGAVAQV